MLITTGKKPDAKTRIIAKSIAAAVPGSRLENRGQRTFSSLISKARRLHFSRVCAIHSEGNQPRSISFLSLEGEKGWAWLSPKIVIRKTAARPSRSPGFRQSDCLSISGTRSRALLTLVSPRNSSEETGSKIVASEKTLAIFAANKKLLELGVSYEE